MIARRQFCVSVAGVTASVLRPAAAVTRTERREVHGFDQVHWSLVGSLSIEQGARELLEIEAEPAVLEKIEAEVANRCLSLRFAPGRIETREKIHVRLQVVALAGLQLSGSGDVEVSALQSPSLVIALQGSSNLRLARIEGDRFAVDIAGSGDVRVDGGRVEAQQIRISGSGDYAAATLASRRANVVIDGSGDATVAASERLDVRIDGSGDVLYHGNPEVRRKVDGAGSVQRV